MSAVLHSPIVHGAVTGFVGAFVADLDAFRKWKSWHDAAEFGWSVASFRWVMGAFFGALGAAGLVVIS